MEIKNELKKDLNIDKQGVVDISNKVQAIIDADPSNRRLNRAQLKERIDDIMNKGNSGFFGKLWFESFVIGAFAKKLIIEGNNNAS
jgi:hypothetical protein